MEGNNQWGDVGDGGRLPQCSKGIQRGHPSFYPIYHGASLLEEVASKQTGLELLHMEMKC